MSGAERDDGRRHPLNVRTTKKTRRLLEEAANASGRSLSQELEFRIERSLDRESVAAALFGSENLRELAEAVGLINRHVDRLLSANPASQAKVNGVDQRNLDAVLQASAGIVAHLQAVNGMDAAEIIEQASSIIAMERNFLVWREAAIAATAQVLGITLAAAAEKVDMGRPVPKTGLDRLVGGGT